jgi:glutamate synthase (NADPH/NADH) small chain
MANPKGFLKYNRELPTTRPPKERIKDYKEFYQEFDTKKTNEQAARCMDCGVPFCHSGCPLGNIIPEFNDAVYREEWLEAYQILNETNNFPEFTGRICPAPCEKSCVLGINSPAVAIEHIEKSIIETAFEKGYIQPNPPAIRTGQSVAIVGSGPAGLAAAAQLNKVGHLVTVFERDDRVGGLLRYGIPDFKLEKWVIDRRIAIMEAEGVRFKTNANVGENVSTDELLQGFDAVILTGGSTVPRNLPIEGRDLKGVYYAMDFLKQNNQRVAGDEFSKEKTVLATDKNVIVIGGGDTGSDCVGTSNRHGAESVTQLELLVKPPDSRDKSTPWPLWPLELRTSSSHLEGCDRNWAILTKRFVGNDAGELTGIEIVNIEWKTPEGGGRPTFVEIEGTAKVIPCELALLAIGFVHPQREGMLEQLGVELDQRGNVQATNYQTNNEKVFVAGDMRRGQSLVVWAISEGREAAKAVDEYLTGSSVLESKTASYLELSV